MKQHPFPSEAVRQKKLRLGGLTGHQFGTDSRPHNSFVSTGATCRDFLVLFTCSSVHMAIPHCLLLTYWEAVTLLCNACI